MVDAYETLRDLAWNASRAGTKAVTYDGDMNFWMHFQSDPRTLNSVTGMAEHDLPRPDRPFKWFGVEVTVKLPKPNEPVVVRRKISGQWLRRNDGKGRMVLFMDGLPPLKVARSEAEQIIRVDMGADLADFEILTITEYEGLTKPETFRR